MAEIPDLSPLELELLSPPLDDTFSKLEDESATRLLAGMRISSRAVSSQVSRAGTLRLFPLSNKKKHPVTFYTFHNHMCCLGEHRKRKKHAGSASSKEVQSGI